MNKSPHVYVNTCINVYMWTWKHLYRRKHHQKLYSWWCSSEVY